MSRIVTLALMGTLAATSAMAQQPASNHNPFFTYLAGKSPAMIAYTPSQLDPRQEANNRALKTSSLRADLAALRPAFDGLVFYGYHEATTPRIMSLAVELKYRAVLLAIWDPKSGAECDGAAAMAEEYRDRLALGLLVGNEGITFGRYELDDLSIAADRLRRRLPKEIPLATSEPLVGYNEPAIGKFGDFMAPNIHPVFDRKELKAEAAAAWVREEAAKLVEKYGKPLLLKETGFPHAGQPEYMPQAQAAFWKAYLAPGRLVAASNKPFQFFGVAFEAFDLPWKSEASGLPIEKSWGLMSSDRQPYPAFEVFRQQ